MSTSSSLGPGAPTPPIALSADGEISARLRTEPVRVGSDLLERLAATGAEVTTDPLGRAEASRDWWPLAMTWALQGQVGQLADAVVRPAKVDQVAQVLRLCDEAGVPVTTAAGRSGVCGASVPVFGGIVLDLTALKGITAVDATSCLVDVLPGTFGDLFEEELRRDHGLTVGHWPQSMALSTVGGWVACRGAGQYSTRYGKIEDMVVGLEVVLADGTEVRTGGHPRSACGPDLTQLFVGSEGTLGVITSVRLRAHPVPSADWRAAFAFDSFAEGLDACRRILQRGATPAVLRLYDAVEADRSYQTGDKRHVLLVLDEGDALLLEGIAAVVDEECRTAEKLDTALVGQWLDHRNDVAALESLISRDYVVDTMEIAGPWSALTRIYDAALAAIGAVEGTLAVSAHQSHSYLDGACLYFTFAGQPPPDAKDEFYLAAWDAGTRAVLANGGALSHHHGVGLNRARFMREALGSAFDVLTSVKTSLDPNGILNPGKLGLPSPFGEVGWP